MSDPIPEHAAWRQFLDQQNLAFPAEGRDHRDPATSNTPVYPDQFVAPLTDLGLIAVTGDDAVSFLHNQITNDVEKLDLASVRLAGYCTPKGRLLASFLMWRDADRIVLQLPRALQPSIQKRLQMFVLRARVKLTDIGEQRVVLGLSGNDAATALQEWFVSVPSQSYQKIDNDNGTLIRLADSRQQPRYQWITTPQQAMTAWPVLAKRLSAVPAGAWRLSDIYAGVPVITPPTQEQFVPQMINFELIGGINFEKGCYPGQEIVARSQYLGKLKRRSVLALVNCAHVSAGEEVFSSEDPGQPCGMVVNAEANAADGFACLVEIKLTAVESGSIHLGAADGPALQLQSLPYELTSPQ